MRGIGTIATTETTQIAGEDVTNDVLCIEEDCTYFAPQTATKAIKTAAGKLFGVFVSSVTDTPTIKICDTAGADTNNPIVETFVVAAATMYWFHGVPCNNGIRVILSGTATYTVFYR